MQTKLLVEGFVSSLLPPRWYIWQSNEALVLYVSKFHSLKGRWPRDMVELNHVCQGEKDCIPLRCFGDGPFTVNQNGEFNIIRGSETIIVRPPKKSRNTYAYHSDRRKGEFNLEDIQKLKLCK